MVDSRDIKHSHSHSSTTQFDEFWFNMFNMLIRLIFLGCTTTRCMRLVATKLIHGRPRGGGGRVGVGGLTPPLVKVVGKIGKLYRCRQRKRGEMRNGEGKRKGKKKSRKKKEGRKRRKAKR